MTVDRLKAAHIAPKTIQPTRNPQLGPGSDTKPALLEDMVPDETCPKRDVIITTRSGRQSRLLPRYQD